jgi:LacI family transcriptional regulator
MLKGIMHYQRLHQPWLVSLHDGTRTESDPCWVRSRKWDGVISHATTPAVVKSCAALHLPLVDLDNTLPLPGVSKIRPDNTAIGHVGAEYFLGRKFRHFGFCGYANHSWSTERRDGYLEALGLAGHRCEIFEVELPVEVTPSWEAKQTALLAAWLRYLPLETAIMACDDERAQQVVHAAQVAGLKVPEEMAVLGANNETMLCELTNPSISSVAINAFEAGHRAAERLSQLIEGVKTGGIDLRIEPVGVVTRKSTDVLAMRDKNVAIALDYIREHACKDITVDQVLQQVYISRSQLEHKFRRYLGHSPQVEIRRVQVAKIRELLSETNLPLKKIAEQTGFEHVEYMCVVFKRITGETPGKYRNKNISNQEIPERCLEALPADASRDRARISGTYG